MSIQSEEIKKRSIYPNGKKRKKKPKLPSTPYKGHSENILLCGKNLIDIPDKRLW